MKIKKAYAIVLSSAFVLCACSTPKPEPTIPTYTVVLQAGEEASFGDKSYLILNNIPEGTMLNQIDGYKTPTAQNPFLEFNYWSNEEGEIIPINTPITSNIQFTAIYANGANYYAEVLNNEQKYYVDYATNRQNYTYEYREMALTIVSSALDIFDGNPNLSPTVASQVYKITHFALEALNKIDAANYRIVGEIGSRYQKIVDSHANCLPYFIADNTQKVLNQIEELSEIYIDYCNAPASYDMPSIIYSYAVDALVKANSPLDLYIANKFANGLMRCSAYITSEGEYENVVYVFNDKVREIKALVTDEEKMLNAIDFISDYIVAYSKQNTFSVHIDVLYNKLLILSKDTSDLFASQKIQMLRALMKANAIMGVNPPDQQEVELFEEIESKLTNDNVNDITSIITRGASALQRCNEHGNKTSCDQFVSSTMRTAISYYEEHPDFLDCILYAMDTAGHLGDLVKDDAFTKEYETNCFGNQYYFDYNRIVSPLESAYNLYKNNISSIPESNVEAFKIVIKGIIKSSLFGGADPSHFISKFTDDTTLGLTYIKELTAPAVNGFAYACAGFACTYANLYGITSNISYEESFNNTMTVEKCQSLFSDWKNTLETYHFQYEADFFGQMVGLCWQNVFTWIAQPFYETEKAAEAYSKGEEVIDLWQENISKLATLINEDNVNTVKNAIIFSLNSSRMHHFHIFNEYQPLEWIRYIDTNNELYCSNGYLKELFDTICNASTPFQLTKRCEIYTTNFVNAINRQNNIESYEGNLSKLAEDTKRLMQEV